MTALVRSFVAVAAAGAAAAVWWVVRTDLSVDLRTIYAPRPSAETAEQGDFSTGGQLVDLNGDGYPDLVIANGNDMSPQPLKVFLNRCKDKSSCFNSYPDYYSDDSDYLGNLAVGDIDHDGWPDVVVGVMFDKQRDMRGGGVKIYKNEHGRLAARPTFLPTQFGVFGCALGDVNGDGQLDLLVAGIGQDTPDGPIHGVPAQIYLNRGGGFAAPAAWQSGNRTFGFGFAVADIDQDGWMDVVLAGEQAFVYPGHRPARPDEVPIAPAPAWSSQKTAMPAVYVDAGRIGAGPALTLAVSHGCLPGQLKCQGDFALYQPAEGTKPTWQSAPIDKASMLVLADLNHDGLLDLVGGAWGNEVEGGPLRFFQGRRAGFPREPDLVTLPAGDGQLSGIAVAEKLTVADTRRLALCPHRFDVQMSHAGAVVTLADRQPAQVTAVEVDGARVPPAAWTFAIGNNWISLATPYHAGSRVRVDYLASPVLDIAEATWNPTRGALLYNSFLEPTECTSQGE